MTRRLMFAMVLLLGLAPALLAQDIGRDLRWGRPQFPRRGGACFFKDAGFRGDYFCMQNGQSASSLPPGFNDRISSIRVFGRTRVNLFNDGNFRGERASFGRDVVDLRQVRLRTDRGKNWGDRISSINLGR